MGILLGQDVTCLTEAYHGKPKELLECEKDFAVIIDCITTSKPIPSKNIKNIESQIASLFNFYKFTLVISNPLPDVNLSLYDDSFPIKLKAANACTPITYFKSMPLVANKLQEKKLFMATVFIDKALIVNYKLTPQETMSIMLHEIGHNFDRSMFTFLSHVVPWDMVLSKGPVTQKQINEYAKMIIGQVGVDILMTGFGAFKNFLSRTIEKIPGFSFIYSHLMNAVRTFNEYERIIGSMRNIKNIYTNVLMWKNAAYATINPYNLLGYASEKYADSFATAYGYGVESATVHEKFMRGGLFELTNDQFAKMNPGVSIITDLARVTTSLPLIFANVHPKSAIRIYSQLQKLKRDLKDPKLPKELKPELESQIAELEKIVEGIIDVRSRKGASIFATTCVNFILIRVFRGKLDPREWLEVLWRHEE